MNKKDAVAAAVEITKTAVASSQQPALFDPGAVTEFVEAVYAKLVTLDDGARGGGVKVV